jgi:hypothetical protein
MLQLLEVSRLEGLKELGFQITTALLSAFRDERRLHKLIHEVHKFWLDCSFDRVQTHTRHDLQWVLFTKTESSSDIERLVLFEHFSQTFDFTRFFNQTSSDMIAELILPHHFHRIDGDIIKRLQPDLDIDKARLELYYQYKRGY